MPPPPSILGARTRRAERIAKEAENAPSGEKSSSTESSSTESSSDESSSDEVEDETNSKSKAKSSDTNSSSADNDGNTENVSDIEDHSVGNKTSDAEDGSDADKIADTNKIADADKIADAGKIADAEHTSEALDNKQSQTAGFSMDTKDAVTTENSKALDSQSQILDNTSKIQQSLPVQDDNILVLSTPLKCPVSNNSDIDMDSPPDLQGASRMTGGIFRGKAYGNVVNHADFPDLAADAVATIESILSFKILAHIEYGDAFSVNCRTSNFCFLLDWN
jgi:hypothetical protein